MFAQAVGPVVRLSIVAIALLLVSGWLSGKLVLEGGVAVEFLRNARHELCSNGRWHGASQSWASALSSSANTAAGGALIKESAPRPPPEA